MKKVFALFAVLFAASVAVGQMPHMGQYSHSQKFSYTTSQLDAGTRMSDCGAGSNNCWHQSWAHNAQFLKVFASNRKSLGIDGNHFGYLYNPSTRNWDQHPEWGAVYALQADSHGNVWALQGNCGSGYLLGEWNGSTFVDQGACFQRFAISQDGLDKLYARDINGTFWIANANGWEHFPYLPGNVDSIAISDANHLYVTLMNGSIMRFVSGANGGSWTTLAGTASEGYGTDVNLAIGGNNDLYVIGNGNNKNIYRWSGSTWNVLNGGGFSSVAVQDEFTIWGVGPMDSKNGVYNDVYQFTELKIENTRSLTTTDTCVGCTHTNKVHAHWVGAHTDDGGYQINYNPNGTSRTIKSSSRLLDALLCVENDPGCTPEGDDSTVCTVAGTLLLEQLVDKPLVLTIGEESIDVENNAENFAYNGPNQVGLLDAGYWWGVVNFHIVDGCPAGTRATCKMQDPLAMFTDCPYADTISNSKCQFEVYDRMADTLDKRDQPYFSSTPFEILKYPDGTQDIRCLPPKNSPDAFLYGAPPPPCN